MEPRGPKMYGGPFHGKHAWFPRSLIGSSMTVCLPIACNSVEAFNAITDIQAYGSTFEIVKYRLVRSEDALVYEGDK